MKDKPVEQRRPKKNKRKAALARALRKRGGHVLHEQRTGGFKFIDNKQKYVKAQDEAKKKEMKGQTL